MYTIFRASLSLNIHVGCCLFSHNFSKLKTIKINDFARRVVNNCFLAATSSFLFNELNKSEAQKKMRSTHACTPSFATFLSNIHVGCCLFSHKYNKMTTKNTLWCEYCNQSHCNVVINKSFSICLTFFSQRVLRAFAKKC